MINQLRETAIMAIVRTNSAESARDLANALLEAQVSVLEFTTTTPDVFDLILKIFRWFDIFNILMFISY